MLLTRLTAGPALTLTHSDPHLGNVLFPRQPQRDPLYLIDFAFHRPWWGMRDIAFTLTFATDPVQRRAIERDLVEEYYTRLVQAGVVGYSWEQCWQDYRLGIITNVRTPLGNRKQPYVRYRLTRAMQAYIDLDCEAILVPT